ncbi:hypothetical protein GCM10011369_19110 [Neiella marina]|uniref:Uncharacterized protein n=1 Tax=Neiella marina TaxID=508461 RepID=A0A8J2U587_9GAMM|nr:hypothetical protein [Neiella marina]GGA77403.1 hypothetical protein GCM10011369_19110 [Neiella marina]
MKTRIDVTRDYDAELIPFNFPAYHNDEGYCYLRIQVKNGKLVFISGQLADYYNTSITNAAESIQGKAIQHLIDVGVIHVQSSFGLFSFLRSKEAKRVDRKRTLLEFFDQNSLWLQFYRAQDSLTNEDFMARTRFPVVERHELFTDCREEIEEYRTYGFDFEIDKTKLENWK